MPRVKKPKGRNKSKNQVKKKPQTLTLLQRLSRIDWTHPIRRAEDFNIVLITTHGSYESLGEENTVTSTLHFNKINAVMPGVYNFLDDGIEFLTLIDVLRSKKLSYDGFVQELQSTLPVIDPLLKRHNSRINLKQIAEEDKMDSQDYPPVCAGDRLKTGQSSPTPCMKSP